MRSSQPKYDTVFSRVSVLLLPVVCLVALIGLWRLPATIPIHFTLSGKANGWGNKYMLLLLPVIASILYVVLGMLCRVPHLFNYMVPITEENAARQYGIAVRMLRQIVTVTMALICFVEVLILCSAGGQQAAWGIWALPVMVSLILVPVVLGIMRSLRSR